MENIDVHIQHDKEILEDATTSPQQRRHIQEELSDLEDWKQQYPEDSHDPTALELFCSKNPSAPECKIYDD